MPHTVVFDPPLLRVRLLGSLTAEAMSEMAAAVRAYETQMATTPDRVFDLTAITGGSLSFPDILRITDNRKKLTFPNSFRTALVAASPIALGYARMFQTLNDHPQITTRTFASIDAAETWLGGPA